MIVKNNNDEIKKIKDEKLKLKIVGLKNSYEDDKNDGQNLYVMILTYSFRQ